MIHQALEELKKSVVIRPKYDNFIGGEWVPPVRGQYFTDPTPVTGRPLCEVARSTAEDVEKALDAAHAAKDAWGKTSPAERVARSQQDRRPHGGAAERFGDGRDARQRQADPRDDGRRHTARHRPLPLLRRLSAPRKESVCEIDHTTYAYHFHEPLGVVGQIIPWNFPLLMAAWKVARRSPPATAWC